MKRILCSALLVALAALPSFSQVAVIANRSVPVNSISISKLSDIYLLNTKVWNDGASIVVLCFRGNEAVEQAFYGSLGVTPLEARKIWMRVQLSGEGKAPVMFTSEDDLIQKVSTTRGAIGFVSAAKVTDAVKVIALIE
jgi:ABC-type phosphate transport system substrate-binding protein